jgi:capsular exopolysaccharide synthesis family protein
VNVTVSTPDFAPETGETKTLMLSDFIRVFRKYFWLLGALSIGFAIIAFLWSKDQPKQYDATAMVQVDQHGMLSLSISSSLSDEYELKIVTQILALQSRDVAMKVIQRLHLENNKSFNPQAPKYTDLDSPATRNHLANLFADGLDVERVPKSELISVTFRSLSQVLSMQVANATVDAYLESNFQHRYQGSKEITGWLTSELDELKARVQSEQSELLNLAVKIGVFSQSATSETSLFQIQLQQLLTESIRVQTERFMSEEQYQQFASDNTGAFPASSVPGAQVLSLLSGQLAQLETQRAALTERYGPGYGPLKQVENQIAAAKSGIAEQRRKVLEAAHQDVLASEKTQADIQARIDALKVEAKDQNPDVVRYQVLKAQYTADQTLYNGLLSLLSAGGIEAGLKTQEVNRMATADIPSAPSRPRIALNTIAGFGIGLLLACLIVGTILAVSDTVETVDQIEEAMALPVLAVVPIYKLDPADSSSAVMPLSTLNAPRSAGAEAYRILRTSINLMPLGRASRVIGITSCGPGEGKSTTAMNLAVAFSQQNKRVLLIDADLRKPALAQRMKLPDISAPGLSRFLSDPTLKPEHCIQPIESLPGLSVMPVQEIPPFPSELLGQGRLEDLIGWSRQNFDIVLIDTPPALLVTDALIVAQSLDIILVVARIGIAQRRALRRVRQELAKFPDKHVAVVVNAVPQSQSYYGGYGGYHGYYGSETTY